MKQREHCVECGEPVGTDDHIPTRQGKVIHLACARRIAEQKSIARESRAMQHIAVLIAGAIGLLYFAVPVFYGAPCWIGVAVLFLWQDRVYYRHLANRQLIMKNRRKKLK